MSVLVVDGAGKEGKPQGFLEALIDQHLGVVVLPGDGRLDERQVGRGYARGAKDYFPEPNGATLLVERVLFRQARSSGREGVGDGIGSSHG
jgi:hypothetical protein